MKIVIQCASGKQTNAGYFMQGSNRILFVAKQCLAPASDDYIVKSPNDTASGESTYQDELSKYNEQETNPFQLLPAYRLYDNDVYRALVKKYGIDNVFILSAGWGLIRASFLTPYYNITFSTAKNVAREFRRGKRDQYYDLCHLPLDSTDDLIFLGGKGYQSLFDSLTQRYDGNRIVFYNSSKPPVLKNCEIRKFETTQRTNWQYTCARKLLDGSISI